MKLINLLTEEELKNLKASSAEDAEIKLNGVILLRKHLDLDAKIERKYFLRLYDNKPDNLSITLNSHAMGLEAKRRLLFHHKIEDGGAESDKAIYLSFYTE